MVVAVREVHDESQHEPYKEPDPREHGQVEHEPQVRRGHDERHPRVAGNLERARQVGALLAHDRDRERHKRERRKRADVDHVGEHADVKACGHKRNDHTHHNLQFGRRAVCAGLRHGARQQAVTAHGEHDAREAEQQHHDHGGQAEHNREADDLGGPVGAHEFERGGERGAVHARELLVGDHAGGHDGHEHVHDDHEEHAHANAERHVALGVLGLFRSGGHHVESDEREEDERRARDDAAPPVDGGLHVRHPLPQRLRHAAAELAVLHVVRRFARRHERRVVRRLDVEEPDDHDEEHDADLEDRHGAVHARADLGAEHEQRGEEPDDDDWRDVDMEGAETEVRVPVEAHEPHEVVEVHAPVFRDDRAGHEHFEDEVPSDDPRHDLADGGVGEGVGGSGDRHDRREFRVAHDGRAAHHAGDDEADDDGWSRVEGGRFGADREDAGAHRHSHSHDGQIPPA